MDRAAEVDLPCSGSWASRRRGGTRGRYRAVRSRPRRGGGRSRAGLGCLWCPALPRVLGEHLVGDILPGASTTIRCEKSLLSNMGQMETSTGAVVVDPSAIEVRRVGIGALPVVNAVLGAPRLRRPRLVVAARARPACCHRAGPHHRGAGAQPGRRPPSALRAVRLGGGAGPGAAGPGHRRGGGPQRRPGGAGPGNATRPPLPPLDPANGLY